MTVHGGIGEDGTLQAVLEDEGVAYTGSLQLMVQHIRFLFSFPHKMCPSVCFIIPSLCLKKGPGVLASRTCMDKVMTSQALSHVRTVTSQYVERYE